MLEALRQLKSPALRNAKGEPLGDITVELSSGTYRLEAPLQLDAASSGNARHTVTIRGPQDRSAIISGGRAVNGFAPVTDSTALARLPKVSHAHVLQTSLPQQGITDFGTQLRHGFGADGNNPTALEITQRNQPLTLARWPNKDFATLTTTPDGEKGLRFTLKGANLAAWEAEPQLLATGYWFNNWADTTLRIAAVEPAISQLTLAAPAPPYGIKAGQRVLIQNALAELDEPGEWYLDRATGTLYLWPLAELRPGDIEASVIHQLLTITKANHITIGGVTLQSNRGDAVSINGGHHVRIENATIRNVGKRGAVVTGQDNGLTNMLIENTGGGGVLLQGGDRQTLTAANLYVESSTLRRFARASRTLQPGVQIEGVGNRATGNTISDSAHTAILFSGNDHLIAKNDISNVCLETGDAGVIYTGRDWTARGTVIEKNRLHKIPPNISWGRTKGVYLDDQASGIIVRGNVFDLVDEAVFIGGGRDNLVEDNTFNGGTFPIHLDARGRNWQKAVTAEKRGTLQIRLDAVPYKQSPYNDRYPNMANILDDEPGMPKYNIARRNMLSGNAKLAIHKDAEAGIQISDSIVLP
nr:right-handed parallel beta-helix repeat-containing protein [uncultured Rhodoferax sp.]